MDLQVSEDNNMMLNHEQEQVEFKPADDGVKNCIFKATFKWS